MTEEQYIRKIEDLEKKLDLQIKATNTANRIIEAQKIDMRNASANVSKLGVAETNERAKFDNLKSKVSRLADVIRQISVLEKERESLSIEISKIS